jgi:hypothetical protein
MTYEQLRDITNKRNNLDLAKECEYLKRISPARNLQHRDMHSKSTATNSRQGAPGGGEKL